MTKKVLILCFLFSSFLGYTQLEDDTYYKEYTGGINFNTNGGFIGGIVGRMTFRATEKRFNVVSLEMVNVKHHKEQRYASPATGSGFIPGKINYLFSVRPQFSQEYILFGKYPEDGVQVSAVFGGGPSFGFIKPYFIEYDYTNYNNPAALSDYRIEAYDPEIHTQADRILGSGGALYGFDQMKLTMGLNFKAGLNFEFGKYQDTVFGVEIGFSYETYTKAIELYPIENNPQSFSSAYAILYFGGRK